MTFEEIITAIGIPPYYQDDCVAIFHGDSKEILPRIPPAVVDVAITDPPYGISYHSQMPTQDWAMKTEIINDGIEDLAPLIGSVLPPMINALKPDSDIYWFCGGGGEKPVIAIAWMEFIKYAPQIKVKNLLVWDKLYGGLGWDWKPQYETIFQLVKGKGANNTGTIGSDRSNIIQAQKVIPAMGDHPTPKCEEVIEKLLLPKSHPGYIVLDPFLGGGTTAWVSKKLNRKCIGIEIEEKYCKLSADRCRQGVFDLAALG